MADTRSRRELSFRAFSPWPACWRRGRATAQVNYAVSGDTAYVTKSSGAFGDIVIASTYNGYPVTSIAIDAFASCYLLTNVTIPNSVTSIGYLAFYNCLSLTNVTMGNSATSIGPSAFVNCSRLVSVNIPDGVTSFQDSVFSECRSLTSVTIPGGVTSIGAGAFRNCRSLTGVAIPDAVTSIGQQAFSGCTSLTRVTIPASVTNIGSSAFYSCSSLTNVTFLGNAPRLVFDIEAGGGHFVGVGAGATAYYYCGTTGWGATYGRLPTVMLFAPRVAPGSAGVKPGGFGFTLTCLTNQTVVEASANPVNWQPIWTNTLPGASADFVDPEWLQHPNRFYRARAD